MPFTGYLKIPDIDGESQAAEVIDKYASVLTDDTEALLKAFGSVTGADNFDFACLTGTFDNPRTDDSYTVNWAKVKIDFTPTATGLAGLRETRAFADEVEASLADAGFDIDLAIKYDPIEKGYLIITMTNVFTSSEPTVPVAVLDSTLTDTSDFDYFL